MKTEDLSVLKINDLSEKQYEKLVQTGSFERNALYLTPDTENVGKATSKGGEIFNDYEKNEAAEDAIAAGTENKANGNYSALFGKRNAIEAKGSYSFGAGSNNTIKHLYGTTIGNGNKTYSPFAMAIGYGCEAGNLDDVEKITSSTSGKGRMSIAAGWGTKASHICSLACGQELSTSANNQTVFGKFNLYDTTNSLFIVGNGTGNYIKNTSSTFNPNEDYYTLNSDGKTYTKQNITEFADGVTYYIRQRSNAFTVKFDGSAEVQTMGSTNNSVVTKKYVDDVVTDKTNTSDIYNPTSSQAMSGVAVSKATDLPTLILSSSYLTREDVNIITTESLTLDSNKEVKIDIGDAFTSLEYVQGIYTYEDSEGDTHICPLDSNIEIKGVFTDSGNMYIGLNYIKVKNISNYTVNLNLKLWSYCEP